MENLTPILNFATLTEMIEKLPTDKDCREYLEYRLWKGTPKCPHCKSENSYKLTTKGTFNGQYKCADCKERYNVKDGTMFEGTHIGLKKWFIAIYIFSLHKKGISSYQLASDLGITQQSAWYLLGRIRMAFKPAEMREKLQVAVQCDETYVGGKNGNKHRNKQSKNSQGRSNDKAPVFGILGATGEVRTFVVPNTSPKTLQPIIDANVDSSATVMTDEWAGYMYVGKNFNHEVVRHSAKQYVNGMVHTNGVENFWSHLKRGITGIYHQVTVKHLHRYCDEFAFRYNSRKQTVNEKFNFSLENSQRLMYKDLIAA